MGGEARELKGGQERQSHHGSVRSNGQRTDVKEDREHINSKAYLSPISSLPNIRPIMMQAVPMVMAESATLNTGQTRKSRKSVTWPKRTRSIIFPTAPPSTKATPRAPQKPPRSESPRAP